jgi:acyl-CoA dehydrogenase
VVLPYFLRYSNEEQRGRWFPGLASGELFTAIAMTEPHTGSDLAGVKTTARRAGNHYILNGSKTFISGGALADLVVVVARTTNPTDRNRRAGLSLIVVEAGAPGFIKGRRLEKLGLKTQDTVELSFNDVRVPAANLLGEQDAAFSCLGHNLAQERLAIAVGAVAQSRSALDLTIDYVKNRAVFGTTVASMQNTKFELSAVAAEIEAAQALVDRGICALVDDELTGEDAAKIKLFCTETQGRVVDRCLQLHGGYGYILEYPIAHLYSDARVTRIFGGTSEVMKAIISKSLGL